jgi:hypothetical protein
MIYLTKFWTFCLNSSFSFFLSFFCKKPKIVFCSFFSELHSTTQTLTTRTHTHPYEYMYANYTPMSTFEGLSTGRSRDSRSHQWRLVIDGNVAYHLTHEADKSWKIQERCEHQDLKPCWVPSHWTVLPLDYNSTSPIAIFNI